MKISLDRIAVEDKDRIHPFFGFAGAHPAVEAQFVLADHGVPESDKADIPVKAALMDLEDLLQRKIFLPQCEAVKIIFNQAADVRKVIFDHLEPFSFKVVHGRFFSIGKSFFHGFYIHRAHS